MISYLDGELSDKSLNRLKETTEIIQPANSEAFVDILLPLYLEILDGTPQFTENMKQTTRQLIVELLSKTLPSCNQFNQFDRVMRCILKIFETDNEINAIAGAKTLVVLFKTINVNHLISDSSLRHLFDFLEKKSKIFYVFFSVKSC